MSSSENAQIASASATGAGSLQAGIIQAAEQTTTGTTTSDVRTTAASSSSSSDKTSASASTTAANTTTKTTTSSSSSATATSTSTSSAQKEATTSSSSSTSSSASSSASSTSTSVTSNTVQSTETPASDSAGLTAIQVTPSSGGAVSSAVFAASSGAPSGQSTAPASTLGSSDSFFQNKAAVAGVFSAVGLVSLILLLAIVLKIVRYRANRRFEKELNEQVEQEVRSGTPMFGIGKEDDGLSIMGGRDPEKAYGGPYVNHAAGGYGGGNTAAYATYGSTAASQPAFYSPNSSNGLPRRYPSQTQSQLNRYNGGEGLSRSNSGGSTRTYGSLNQPPMNAFVSSTAPAPSGTNFAPATFAANYGEYRNGSPAPSLQSNQSHAPYGARPGTPSSLTPGGTHAPAVPRGAYTSLGTRSDSPAVLQRYGSQGVRDGAYAADAYISSGRPQVQVQTQGRLGVAAAKNEAPSPRSPLPNPFDQRN